MNSITEIWEELSNKYKNNVALKDEISGYSLTFNELNHNINKVVKILKKFNIGLNDKVIIYLNVHPLWHVINQAIMKNNSISVPCEPTANYTEINYILNHTESKVIFTNNVEFIEKLFIDKEFNVDILTIFYIGDKDISKFNNDIIKIYNFFDILEKVHLEKNEISKVENTDNIATIIYSSGTTGDPKGAVVTHKNLFLAVRDHRNTYGKVFGKKCINIHSCAHVAPHIIELVFLSNGNTIIYTSYIKFLETVKKYKADYLFCVPKLLSILFDEYKKNLKLKNKLVQTIYNTFFKISLSYIQNKEKKNIISKSFSLFLYPLHLLNYKYFCKNILNYFINPNTSIMVFGNLVIKNIEDFYKVIGIDLLTLYGLTEAVTYVSFTSTKSGIANKLNPNIIVEIRDLQNNKKLSFDKVGLIKIKGEQIMKEYYKDEEKTKNIFDNGYLVTGDLGYITKDNYLCFEGRQKNIIALSNGEKVNSLKIENICKESSFINQIVIIGQDKPYLTALIVLDKNYVNKWAKEKYINLDTEQGKKLLKRDVLIDINNLVGKDKFFKWIEQIKNISFIEEPFTCENGLLTKKYTIIKNKVVDKYKNLIDSMY